MKSRMSIKKEEPRVYMAMMEAENQTPNFIPNRYLTSSLTIYLN